jgi:hypothetical protein
LGLFKKETMKEKESDIGEELRKAPASLNSQIKM